MVHGFRFNLNFLVDNVRASDDLAKENHIYLFYESIEEFSLTLAYMDFEPLLKREKIVFLIGEEEKNLYPIDFKQRFGIDYEAMEFQEVRPEEIVRIAPQIVTVTAGYSFIKQILSINQYFLCFADNQLSYFFARNIYSHQTMEKAKQQLDSFTETKDLSAIISMFYPPRITVIMFDGTEENQQKCHDFFCFFELFWSDFKDYCLRYNIKAFKDFVIAFTIIYAKHKQKENFLLSIPSRISPMFSFSLHPFAYVSEKNEPQIQNFYKLFPYCYPYSLLRDPVYFLLRHACNNYPENIQIYFGDLNHYHFSTTRALMNYKTNSMNTSRKIIRYEDLKLNPVATLTVFYEFLNVPYVKDVKYMDLPKVQVRRGVAYAQGFSVEALYNKRLECYSEADRYVLEQFLFPYWSSFGYKPAYWNEQKIMNEEELLSFEFYVEKRFKDEKEKYLKYHTQEEFNDVLSLIRTKTIGSIKQMFIWRKHMEKLKKSNNLKTFEVLYPKKELMVNKLYENQDSLPLLANTNIDFLNAPLLYPTAEKGNINE